MKVLKKVLLGVLSLACVATASVGLTACQDGKDGKSAYEIWLANGYSGTEADFLDWLKADGTTQAQEGTDGLAYYPLPDGTYAVGKGNTMYLEEIVIPSTYKGKAVTALADNAFLEAKVKSITIPDSVTSIGDRAFSSCYSLTSVVIGDSVTSIGYEAFFNCSSLTSVVIPDSVTSIGNSAFYSCSSLTSVSITDIAAWCAISFGTYNANPLYYAKNLYLNNELVTDLVIPDSVTSIGDYAFYYCSSLTSVVIPDSVTSIGSHVFYGCSSLTSVYYKGSASDWNNIYIGSYNTNNSLIFATKYSYSESQPTEEGNYWYYDENGEVAVW